MFRMWDLAAPLYDLGVWLFAIPFGGENRLREEVLAEALACGAGGRAGARTLEVFCGTATLSLMAARRGFKATALDLSGGMLRVAREKSVAQGVAISLVRATALALPFRDDSFDRVIVSMGLHEASIESIPVILKEARRVLEDAGRLTVFDYHRADGLAGLMQRAVLVFTEGEKALSWISADLQGMLREAGFKNFKRSYLAGRALQIVTAEKL